MSNLTTKLKPILMTFLLSSSLIHATASADVKPINDENADQSISVSQRALRDAAPSLQNLIDNKFVEVIKRFSHDTLDGWLVKTNDKYQLYWQTIEGYLVAGPLIDKKGINLTGKYLERMMPTPNFDNALERLKKSNNFFSTQPDDVLDGNEMWVFIEPFCGWCDKLKAKLEPHINKGLVVNWVPVAFLSPKSADVIEYILTSDDAYGAYSDHEKYKRTGLANNYQKPAQPATRELLASNSRLMKEFGVSGTPGIVYESKGKTIVTGYTEGAKFKNMIADIMSNNK